MPLRQFRCLIGRGCELNCSLRNTRDLEEWIPTNKLLGPFGGSMPGVPLLEMRWSRESKLSGSDSEIPFHGVSETDPVEGDWRLDAVRNDCRDGSDSSFTGAIDEAIRSLERETEQLAVGQEILSKREGAENEVGARIETFGFTNVLDAALGILEAEDYSDEGHCQERLSHSDQDDRTLEWILDHSVQWGSSDDGSDVFDDEELSGLGL